VPEQVVSALHTGAPGNSLALWLAAHHPDLFLAVYKSAQAHHVATAIRVKGLRGLADDGVTTTFDSEPGLQTISVNTDFAPTSFLSDATPAGSSFLDSLGSGFTSFGSTIGGAVSSAGSTMLGALGSVGSYLTSANGLNSLTGLAKTYFAAQGATANAQTQQAVLQAQTSRVATGQPVAPIRYTTDANGNAVPVYVTQTPQGAVYQPLSHQGIASLTPSGVSVFISQYGLYIGLGVAALIGLTMMLRR
jgi:hypothetical protein